MNKKRLQVVRLAYVFLGGMPPPGGSQVVDIGQEMLPIQ